VGVPKALYLVKLWRVGNVELVVGDEVIEFADYVVFAYYMLRYGKLINVGGLRWCTDIYDGDCVRLLVPCPNLPDGIDGYLLGSVDFTPRARNALGILIPSKDEQETLLKEGKVIDLTPEEHLSSFLACRELRKRCLEMQDKLRKLLEEVNI